MKNPREVLLSKHQSAQPKLDSLREQIVSRLAGAESQQAHQRPAAHEAPERVGWLQLLQMLRWHLVGLSAVWALILLLRLSGTEVQSTSVAQLSNEPPPRTTIALLKENRRQIAELGDSLSSPPAAPAAPKSGRSAIQVDWAYS
jgi:hypothetical protein